MASGRTAKAARRAARAALQQRDPQCAAIAQHVYAVARELKDAGEDAEAMPLEALAPVVAAAERVAPGTARMADLDATDAELVADVASYLVAGFRELAVFLHDGHFARWREATQNAVGSARKDAHTDPDD